LSHQSVIKLLSGKVIGNFTDACAQHSEGASRKVDFDDRNVKLDKIPSENFPGQIGTGDAAGALIGHGLSSVSR
jgi:hypothetical protein